MAAQSPEPPVLRPSPMSDLLIDFILAEILPKLPAKSLIRFKAVCKSFKTLISSPEFARLHLRHSLSSDNCLLYTFDLDSLSSVRSAPSATFYWPQKWITVVGSCNGLLISQPGTRVLLNPASRTYINIPHFAGVPRIGNVGLGSGFGFGFDDCTDDYKIVLIYDNIFNNVVKIRVTAVYSLSSKTWKVVDQTHPPDSIEERYGGVLINNHLLHWTFWSPSKRKRRIGCFDVCGEKWKEDVLLPIYYYDPSHRNYLLDVGVLDDRLFSSFENRVDSSFDVWVMKEYGVQESWIKLLSISISDDLNGGVVPVACRGVGLGEVLLRQRHKSKLFWYNREDGVIIKVEVPDFGELQPYICKGSLVSLPGAKLFGAIYDPDD